MATRSEFNVITTPTEKVKYSVDDNRYIDHLPVCAFPRSVRMTSRNTETYINTSTQLLSTEYYNTYIPI